MLGNNNKSPSSAGATLFVVYRDPTQPLTSIVVYDGIVMQPKNTAMTQTIRGFLQSSTTHSAKMHAHRRQRRAELHRSSLVQQCAARSQPVPDTSRTPHPIVNGPARRTT